MFHVVWRNLTGGALLAQLCSSLQRRTLTIRAGRLGEEYQGCRIQSRGPSWWSAGSEACPSEVEPVNQDCVVEGLAVLTEGSRSARGTQGCVCVSNAHTRSTEGMSVLTVNKPRAARVSTQSRQEGQRIHGEA